MSAPVLTLTDSQNNPVSVLNFGVVDAGTLSGGNTIRVWNNLANAPGISSALNPTITTKTFNGYDNGDSVQNGEEIVTQQMIQVQATSIGATTYTAVGGTTVAEIGDAVQGAGNPPPPLVISSNRFAEMLIRANIPQSATAGNINFLIRVNFQYN